MAVPTQKRRRSERLRQKRLALGIIDKDDDTIRPWADLPHGILSAIANDLGIVELMIFRSCCKDFRAASSSASAEIESKPDRCPWFLLYGDGSETSLYPPYVFKRYVISLPEMEGAICLASNFGWLLLFREGSVFFFCPFSRAKIVLPDFPYPKVEDHVATFSSPPTSPDCIVSVINKLEKDLKLEVNMIKRGDSEWAKHEFQYNYAMGKITCAVFNGGLFYYMDNDKAVVTFSPKDETWQRCVLVEGKSCSEYQEKLPFNYTRSYCSRSDTMKSWLGLNEDVSVSICGTPMPKKERDMCIHNETIAGNPENHRLKGVWIQPRFYQVPENQSWSI